jgi:SagB-type dehydrogenase family enzyme
VTYAADADPALLFHSASSNVKAKVVDLSIDHDNRPRRFVSIPGAQRIVLPKGNFRLAQPLGAALQKRLSTREFELKPMALARLSQLLFTSYGARGVRKVDGETVVDRCTPSAGGLYPIELYVTTQRVAGVPDGIHHYDARFHRLETVATGQHHGRMAELTIGQDMIRDANVVVVLAAMFRRTMWKYGTRGYRYVWLDAGHIGQNLYLAAGALALGAVAIGGFFDLEVNRLLRLPSDETAVYMVCIGNPRSKVRRARRNA